MTAATIERKPFTAPARIGTGELHQALEDAKDHARLIAFAASVGCAISDVCTPDGKRLDMLRTLALMRQRGYTVGDPHRPQSQLRKGHTTWCVSITLPSGASCAMAFFTPN